MKELFVLGFSLWMLGFGILTLCAAFASVAMIVDTIRHDLRWKDLLRRERTGKKKRGTYAEDWL